MINIKQNENHEVKKSSAKKQIKTLDKVLSEYRKIYARQLGSNYEVKEAALKKAISIKCTDIYTEDVFNHEIAERIDLLLSSAHFKEAVKDKGLDPFNAASHFVLLGWQKLEDCILRGGYNAIQNYEEWKKPMFDRDTMESYTPHIKAMQERATSEVEAA